MAGSKKTKVVIKKQTVYREKPIVKKPVRDVLHLDETGAPLPPNLLAQLPKYIFETRVIVKRAMKQVYDKCQNFTQTYWDGLDTDEPSVTVIYLLSFRSQQFQIGAFNVPQSLSDVTFVESSKAKCAQWARDVCKEVNAHKKQSDEEAICFGTVVSDFEVDFTALNA